MRVAVLSRRATSSGPTDFPAYGVWTEAEDVLIEAVSGQTGYTTDSVDVAELSLPIQRARVRVRRHAGRFIRQVGGPHTRVPAVPRRLDSSGLHGRYDLIVFLAYSVWDLPLLERLGELRDHGDQVAVWFLETWPSAFAKRRIKQEPFHTVDHIFVGIDVAVEPLAKAIGRSVNYLPMATDTLRFSPSSPLGDRPIDVFVPGRRDEAQHAALLDWATANNRRYHYDKARVGAPKNLKAHRDALGERYSQTKVSICNYAKKGEASQVGSHRGLPGRLWEAWAAGCATVGDPPSASSQREVFGREVVAAMPEDSAEVASFLEHVIDERNPTAVAKQVSHALLGQDWAHRWVDLFDQLQLPTPAGLRGRVVDLADRAAAFQPQS